MPALRCDVLTSGSVIVYRLSDLGDEIDLCRGRPPLRRQRPQPPAAGARRGARAQHPHAAARAQLLEIAIVLLFVLDIALALFGP